MTLTFVMKLLDDLAILYWPWTLGWFFTTFTMTLFWPWTLRWFITTLTFDDSINKVKSIITMACLFLSRLQGWRNQPSGSPNPFSIITCPWTTLIPAVEHCLRFKVLFQHVSSTYQTHVRNSQCNVLTFPLYRLINEYTHI